MSDKIKIGPFTVEKLDSSNYDGPYDGLYFAYYDDKKSFGYLRPDGQVSLSTGASSFTNEGRKNIGYYKSLDDVYIAYSNFLKMKKTCQDKFYGDDTLIHQKLVLLEVFLEDNSVEIGVNEGGEITFQGMPIHKTNMLPRPISKADMNAGKIRKS